MLKWFVLFASSLFAVQGCKTKIDREAVFSRHTIHINEIDTLNPLTLGNGRFAMTMDVTGLQTFPLEYHKGIPLGTQSEWGWHSFPSNKNYPLKKRYGYLNRMGGPYLMHVNGRTL